VPSYSDAIAPLSSIGPTVLTRAYRAVRARPVSSAQPVDIRYRDP
jgi:hypothetical protein